MGRAVEEVDPTASGKWSRAVRPVRGPGGIDTEVGKEIEGDEARVER
jgi:hypothetical protein